ncbi:hypothetical protein Ahy_A02g007380 [Arachis hypogaea]|uniref:Uncharacterized protein n=1 Tax=Arachis hypogaea TaxID=3818 RepID=A0A445ECE7_ARAHY|nr:hypothetical protein Ahy_A02g007380 [Arachis hypogaea]
MLKRLPSCQGFGGCRSQEESWMNLQSPISPRKDVVQNRCLEFMQLIKLMKIQLPLVFAFYKFLIQIDRVRNIKGIMRFATRKGDLSCSSLK